MIDSFKLGRRTASKSRADEIRTAAGQPGFLVGVLDFVLAHEPTLIAFCQNSATEPESVQIARDKLDASPIR